VRVRVRSSNYQCHRRLRVRSAGLRHHRRDDPSNREEVEAEPTATTGGVETTTAEAVEERGEEDERAPAVAPSTT